jgi:site-specific DNA recombinase
MEVHVRTEHPRAGIYARISEDQLGDELGVNRQLKNCRELCAHNGFTVSDEHIYIDNNISASSGKRREHYERLLADVIDGEIDVIVAYHADRLHRRPIELERFIEVIDQHRVQVATVMAGQMDLSTGSGRMVARILGDVARHEADRASERISRKHRELAETGQAHGAGCRPFGYEDDRVTIRESEAALIQDAARDVLAGTPLFSICQAWTAQGVPTPAGARRWWTSTLRGVLKSPRIAGWRAYKGQPVAPAVWPAIISLEQHQRLVALFADPTRTKNHGVRSGRFVLTGGLLRCGRPGCGFALAGRHRGSMGAIYMCMAEQGGCNRLSVAASQIETFVRDAVIDAVANGALERLRTRTETEDRTISELSDEIGVLRDRRVELAEAFAADRLSLDGYETADRKLNGRIDELRDALSMIGGKGPLPKVPRSAAKLREWWENVTIAERHELVATLLEYVVILPVGRGNGNRFNPDRVQPHWRV